MHLLDLYKQLTLTAQVKLLLLVKQQRWKRLQKSVGGTLNYP